MKIPRLSVVMLTLNRKEKVQHALESIQWADEIIILDGGSTDGTLDICKKYTDKIFSQPKNINSKMQNNIDLVKNEGFQKATSDWILNLDSDEIVPLELAKEIKITISSSSPSANGFLIPRTNYYWGKHVRCLDPDYQLRLFKKDTGKFSGNHIHEKITIDGHTAYLQGRLIHHSYDSITDFLKRSSFYFHNELYCLNEEKEKKSIVKLITLLPRKFYYYYLQQGGFKDGVNGFIVSWLYSFYYFVPYLVFLLKRRQREQHE